ncbi:unnamed protein product [Linum trigynum]|uniref:Uncharacterized protein n=1 Tax=Linum trigynum TaxID=586398 RepID=A0AAV2FTH3_9ROSI
MSSKKTGSKGRPRGGRTQLIRTSPRRADVAIPVIGEETLVDVPMLAGSPPNQGRRSPSSVAKDGDYKEARSMTSSSEEEKLCYEIRSRTRGR